MKTLRQRVARAHRLLQFKFQLYIVCRMEKFSCRFGLVRHSQRFGSGIAKHGLELSEGKWTNPTLLELWNSAPVAMAAGSVSQSDIDNEDHPGRGDG